MNTEQLTDLAVRTQAGDEGALLQLLAELYHTVFYQCRMILQDDAAAETLTREILSAVPEKAAAMENPGNVSKWVQRRVASRCSSVLTRMRWEDPEHYFLKEQPTVQLSGGLLDEEQTAHAVAQMAACLPEEQRICMVLHSCGGMSAAAIARAIEEPEETVANRLNQAKEFLKDDIREQKKQGVTFLGLAPLPILMQTDMEASRDEAAAQSFLAPYIPQPKAAAPTQEAVKVPYGKIILITSAVMLVICAAAFFFLR